MTLTDEQRAWLDTAVQSKGKFTLKRVVKKRLEKYLRRREKVAKATAGLTSKDRNYNALHNLLNTADDMASKGQFKEAYASLERAKTQSRKDVAARSQSLDVKIIRDDTSKLVDDVKDVIAACDSARAGIVDFIASEKAANLGRARDCTDLSAAIAFRQQFVAEETRLRGTFDTLKTDCMRAGSKANNTMIAREINRIEVDIRALEASGRGEEVADCVPKLESTRRVLTAKNGLYADNAFLNALIQEKMRELDEHIADRKEFGDLVSRDDADVTIDADILEARGELTRDDAARLALVAREEERLDRARAEVLAMTLKDQGIFSDTSTNVGIVTPELPTFVPSDALDGLTDGLVLGETISDSDRNLAVTKVAAMFKSYVTDTTSDPYEIFDLTLQSTNELRVMIANELFGFSAKADLTDSQFQVVKEACEEIETVFAQNLPTRIEADGSEVTVGGKTYYNPVVLKSGGNGTATRFTDASGDSVVVKTTLSGENEEMIREMQTHMRIMSGRDQSDSDDGIVDFLGAARAPDGSLHMVMEDVKGGDLEDLTRGMEAAVSFGLIPESARQAIALNNVLGTVKALKNLEQQGLVHHDIKGENVMMAEDGRIRIIDFGESGFLQADGTLQDHQGATTPGYGADEAESQAKDRNTKVDVYAISGMLENMIAGYSPKVSPDAPKMQGGALGRLVGALSDPDPKKRPSLDAILTSTLVESYNNDYGPEAIKDMQAASLEFSMQVSRVKGNIDVAELKKEISSANHILLKDPMPLKAAQNAVMGLEAEVQRWTDLATSDPVYFNKKNGRQMIVDSQNDLAIFKTKIANPILRDAVQEAESAYEADINNPNLKFEIHVDKKKSTVTAKQAVQARDKIRTQMDAARARITNSLSDATSADDGMQDKLDRVNALLVKLDRIATGINEALYAALGPKAKFFWAKEKMEKAAALFGPN